MFSHCQWVGCERPLTSKKSRCEGVCGVCLEFAANYTLKNPSHSYLVGSTKKPSGGWHWTYLRGGDVS